MLNFDSKITAGVQESVRQTPHAYERRSLKTDYFLSYYRDVYRIKVSQKCVEFR